MAESHAAERPASLLGITVRRSFVIGRIYVVIAIAYVVIFGVVTGVSSGNAFESVIGLFLPVFAVVGSLGGLTVFTNDRVKGVYEYLLAYGLSPRRLFANVLAASLVLTSIVIGISLAAGLGAFLGSGHALTAGLVEVLGLYALPMSYVCVTFAATVGMYWTSLSSPRMGMSSPVGLMPIVGIAPSLITVVAVTVLAPLGVSELDILAGALLATFVVTLSLLSRMSRLMPLERLLSPV
jgi:multisubunit Na+/H+ antiporter MnhC subunit